MSRTGGPEQSEDRHPGEPSEAGRVEEAESPVHPPGTHAPADAETKAPGEWTEAGPEPGQGKETADETLPAKPGTLEAGTEGEEGAEEES